MSKQQEKSVMKKMEGSGEDSGGGSFAVWALGGLAIGAGLIAAWALMNEAESRPTVTLVSEQHRPMVSRTFFERNITQDKCAICYEFLCNACSQVQQQIVQLVCGHIFHRACVDEWFQTGNTPARACPECRQATVDTEAQAVTEKCKETRTEKE